MKTSRSETAHRVAVLLVLALTLSFTAIPALAAPPEDLVNLYYSAEEVPCDSGSLDLEIKGWLKPPTDWETGLFRYHLARTYTNPDGDIWKYQDTGILRLFDADVGGFTWLAGHSVNVGPDETGWYGHWVFEPETGEVLRFGHGPGDVHQLACERLID